jgi:hypothetical protein
MLLTASHLRNLRKALGTWRRALEESQSSLLEFESALLEFESALLELEETPVCEVCGEAFWATQRDLKTCSAACSKKAHRRRAQHLSFKRRRKLSRAILDAPVPSVAEHERDRGDPA